MKFVQVYQILMLILSFKNLTDSSTVPHHRTRHGKLEQIRNLPNLENLSLGIPSDELLSNEILSHDHELQEIGSNNRQKRTNEPISRSNSFQNNEIPPLRTKASLTPSVPTYLKLVHESLISSESQNEIYKHGHRNQVSNNAETPLLRALVPTEITHGDLGMTLIKFNISRAHVGIFNSAQIIFTRNSNDEMELHDGSHICVNLEYGNNQDKQSQPILPGIKFYTFDFTDFLKTNLNSDLASRSSEENSHNHIIILDVIVFKNNRRKQVSVEALFDLESDRPFIFLQYVNTVYPTPQALSSHSQSESKTSTEYEENRFTKRVKRLSGHGNPNESLLDHEAFLGHRSLNPPSPNICKYHSWMVKPSDVGLENVLSPQYLNLGYCAGECPFPLENDVFNFTLHSFLVDRNRLLKGYNTPYNLPEPKCVPVSYTPITVLVEDVEENNYTAMLYYDGSVASCGCR